MDGMDTGRGPERSGTASRWADQGSTAALPPALRSILASPQPLWIGWGPDLLVHPNDAARALCPAAAGRPATDAWGADLSDLLDAVRSGRPAAGTRALLLDAGDGLREAHLHFALSPLPEGGVLGILTDRTAAVLAERRRRLLAALAGPVARTLHDLCALAGAAMAEDGRDLPFAMLYLAEGEGFALAGACGIAEGHPAVPPRSDGLSPWPLREAAASGEITLVSDLRARWPDLPTGPWSEPPREAALVPLPAAPGQPPGGVLVAGLNPFGPFDEPFRAHLRLFGAQVGLAIAAVRSAEAEETLRHAAARSTFLQELGDALRPIEDPDAIMVAAAALLGRCLRVARCGYVENDPTGTTGTVARDWTDGRMPSAAGTHDLAGYGAPMLERLRAGKAVALDDVPADPRLTMADRADYARHGGIRAALGVPLVKDGAWIATLFAHDAEPRRWTADDIDLVREAAERTWLALEAARATRALRERESLTRGFLEASSDSIAILSLGGRLRAMSPAGQRAMEAETWSELAGRPWPSLWPAPERGKVEAALARAREGGVGAFRGALPSLKGRPRHWDVVVTPVLGEDGRPARLLAVSRDVSAQRRAEGALRESEARFRAMADSAPVMIWTTDAEGACTYVNRVWSEFTGRPPSEAMGPAFATFVHPEDRPVTEAISRAAKARQEPFRLEYRLRAADGGWRWVIDTASPRLAGDGTFLGYTGSVIDITDRKRAEERRGLLVNELNHRVKNTLATVQSLAAQSFRLGQVDRAVRVAFEGRLQALASAHDVLTRQSWEGASLADIAGRALAPFGEVGSARLRVAGPEVSLPPRMVLALAMALHELATNAAKYGALSGPRGRVELSWDVILAGTGRRLRLHWAERDGPPVAPPARRGFGSRLIETGLAAELDGEVAIGYHPSGVECRLDAPLPPLRDPSVA